MSIVLSKWGNSTAIRIPTNIVAQCNLSIGDQLSLRLNSAGHIVLEPKAKTIDFAALYAQITDDTAYNEVSTGQTLGREAVEW